MPMVTMPPERLERETRRAAEILEADRAWRRRRAWYVLAAAGFVLAGIIISGFGFAVTDEVLGEVLMLAGVTVGDVGVLAVIMFYAVNSEQ
jgi:ABC-type tungstate transport system substrate-binding protein